ncbi:MAG: response regulator [Ginsengibacter sp.]
MKKILVINNDIDTMSLLKNWLEKKSYTVKYTGNEEEVPAIMEDFSPHLVIADVMQHELVERLKKNKKTRSIPVLLMTGYTLRQTINRLPGDDIIEKPFNLALFEKKIERLIQKVVTINAAN